MSIAVTGCGATSYPDEFGTAPLPSCSEEDTPFKNVDFAEYDQSNPLKPPTYGAWNKLFEERLFAVIDAHAKALLEEAEDGGASSPLQCTASTYQEMFPGNSALQSLAGELPAFRNRTSAISEMDIAPVVLEWLRVYECAMHERSRNAEIDITDELQGMDAGSETTYPVVLIEASRRRSYVQKELIAARALVSRATTLLGGFGRLRPLAAEITCLQRISADIRNNIALLGEASACLPRALNARGSLRDFELNEEEEP